MSKALLTNQKLLEVLGLQGLSIASLDIACRVNELPRVTAVIHPHASAQAAQVQHFSLVVLDAPASTQAPAKVATEEKPLFDLDAICFAATQRIHSHINRIARDHLFEIKRGLQHIADPARIRSLPPEMIDHIVEAAGSVYGLQRKGR